MTQFFSWIGVLAVFAFIVFAFRQGMRVKPDGRQDRGPPFRPSDLER